MAIVYSFIDVLADRYTRDTDYECGSSCPAYSDVKWLSSSKDQPTQSQIDAWVEEKNLPGLLTEVREKRNAKLTKTDWTQNSDVPEATRTKWTAYRQSLRDLPADASKFSMNLNGDVVITWPTEPS